MLIYKGTEALTEATITMNRSQELFNEKKPQNKQRGNTLEQMLITEIQMKDKAVWLCVVHQEGKSPKEDNLLDYQWLDKNAPEGRWILLSDTNARLAKSDTVAQQEADDEKEKLTKEASMLTEEASMLTEEASMLTEEASKLTEEAANTDALFKKHHMSEFHKYLVFPTVKNEIPTACHLRGSAQAQLNKAGDFASTCIDFVLASQAAKKLANYSEETPNGKVRFWRDKWKLSPPRRIPLLPAPVLDDDAANDAEDKAFENNLRTIDARTKDGKTEGGKKTHKKRRKKTRKKKKQTKKRKTRRSKKPTRRRKL